MNPGARIGPYRIVAPLGSGGMGVVFRAWDERLEREVALKLLPIETANDPIARARLLREARAAAALSHPQICTVFEVGESEGRVFLAMELVEGETIAQRISRHPAGLPSRDVFDFGAQIAGALAHAHARGVVHRDLKSANVLVSQDARIKVLDFGLAHRGVSDTADVTRSVLTTPGTISGTPTSLAPEVWRGETSDAKTDLWSLGVLLHEMASGSLPFGGKTGFELAAAILHEPPAPLPDRLPAGFLSLVGRCLEKDPARRISSASEVRAGLEALTPDSPRRLALRLWPIAAACAMAVLAVAITILALRGASPPVRAIAVLPIENLSNDPGQDYFSDGMTEELITHLAQVASLRVISRSSVMRYRDSPASLSDIARELRVDAVVEGSVLRSGEKVRINVRLVRARNEQHLWAGEYERETRDILRLQNDVCRAIVEHIRATISPTERARLATSRPIDPRAHDAWLRGRYQWNLGTEEGLRRAIDEFRVAAAIDSTYAPAYSGLAESYTLLSNIYTSPEEVMPLALAAADRAITLDSTLADAYGARAYVRALFEWRWPEARNDLARALSLNPNSLPARLTKAYLHLLSKEFDAAEREYAIAAEIDPLSGTVDMYRCILAYEARRFAESDSLARELRRRFPEWSHPRFVLSQSLLQSGRVDEAISQIDSLVAVDPHPHFKACRAYAHSRSGDPSLIGPTRQELRHRAVTEWVNPYSFAVLEVAAGNREEAIEALEDCVDRGIEEAAYLAVDPIMDPLRDDPRFDAMLVRVGVGSGRR